VKFVVRRQRDDATTRSEVVRSSVCNGLVRVLAAGAAPRRDGRQAGDGRGRSSGRGMPAPPSAIDEQGRTGPGEQAQREPLRSLELDPPVSFDTASPK
jgi:hypothetical protein